MSFTIPFTEESVREEICGRVMVCGLRAVAGHRVTKINEEVKLSELPDDDGVKWKIEDGCIKLLSKRDSETCVLNAVEVESNRVFLSGESYNQVGDNPSRILMYEKVSLEQDFHVIISSHVDYEEVAVPRLIRSLRREGVQEDKITVVVSDSEELEKDCEYNRLTVPENLLGFVGLIPFISGKLEVSSKYILLLHDTCEVVPGFMDKLKNVDIGLPYDIIEGLWEIGLWSVDFLKRESERQGFKLSAGPTYHLFDSLKEMSRLSYVYRRPRVLRSKDVYGTGIKRQVSELVELGIKKYSGAKNNGGLL